MTKNILITGGLGFIGSNFILYLIEKYPMYKLYNFDSITYAADERVLKDIEHLPNYQFIKGDIRNKVEVHQAFHDYQITDIIHFAAESHVDNSIKNPNIFAETNIMGTLNLLDVARNFWMDAPFVYKEGYQESRFHHISTDEVYGSLDNEGYFTENSPYEPNSPYSASKASSDMLVRSFYHTYGMNVVTTNCSNNYGPHQHSEKLIPKLIKRALNGEPLPIYGTGENIRDWLFVKDHCSAIDKVFHSGKSGETYLVGGNSEKTNLQIVNSICDYLDKAIPQSFKYSSLITFVEDRHGHDYRYAIDATKLKNELNWTPAVTFEMGLEMTIDWYIKKYREGDKSNEK